MSQEPYGYIYLILDQKENKVYIGQKKGLPENSKNYFGSGTIIRNIIKKRGTYFLKKIILGFCYSRDEILQKETECKYFFNAFDRKYGYNIAISDNGGILYDVHPMLNKKQSDESKLKNRNSHLGKIASHETKKKLKIKRVGRTPALGMKHTDEWRINHSLKMSGENSPRAKPIYQLNNNFEIIYRFGTIKEAAKIFNIHRCHIDKSCQNKTMYKDNYFIYEGELNEFIKKNCIKHNS
jgi:group I intron endonuclease